MATKQNKNLFESDPHAACDQKDGRKRLRLLFKFFSFSCQGTILSAKQWLQSYRIFSQDFSRRIISSKVRTF